mmetsp:Transcript_28277/g.43330  ORF Transcript_28277/g.43330 Transcript_28277/m.43330 type:complete len:275 (-) Transcript_28277:609-1433(-)
MASRGTAPHMPLKRSDKLSGMMSIEAERKNERSIRKSYGDDDMGSGYTTFKRRQDKDEIAARKRRKLIEERRRPDDVKYFFKTDSGTFEGWKEDYVFTTKDRGTGYYWDGMDSVKKLSADEDVTSTTTSTNTSIIGSAKLDNGENNKEDKTKGVKDKKKKKKKEKSKKKRKNGKLPSGWEETIDPFTAKLYFFNRKLNKTVWDRPTSDDEFSIGEDTANEKGSEPNGTRKIINDKSSGDDSLPEGWQAAKDPSTGKEYYYHVESNETVWDRPQK